MAEKGEYYVPESSKWPIVGSVGLFALMVGIINWLHGHSAGPVIFMIGAIILVYMMYGWFGDVIKESIGGLHNAQMDRSYRGSMYWFIFSEVMFFAAFFGALFYARVLSGPWLAGDGGSTFQVTHSLLWPDFKFDWPLLINPDPKAYVGPSQVIGAAGLPLINTLLLLTSGVTITWAHWALKKDNRFQLLIGLGFTIMLGMLFLLVQCYEYYEAYHVMGLKLSSGMYGTTFFMLTGFHGAHVTIGTVMLIVCWLRCAKGHFKPKQHFAFEAISWYWHFVDVVWLLLYVFVYWL